MAAITLSCGGSPATTALPTAPTTPFESPANPSPPAASARPTEWDPATQGLPHFVSHQSLDLDAIGRISRFRSGEGHSYSDEFEGCRSMKHYFDPRVPNDAARIRVFSPVHGTVVEVRQEWAGAQIRVMPTDYPAFHIILFHVNVSIPLAVGTELGSGQQIGMHVGSQTMSDVAVAVGTPAGYQLVSWFDVLDEPTFAAYQARGVATRSNPIISRVDRDARPLSCAGEAFADKGVIDNWVVLR